MAVKYKWLAGRLETLIRKNIREGINKLPTEQELCEKYGLSRQTVRMALKTLEEKGLIDKKRGSGSYITGRSPKSRENEVGILIFNDQDYLYPAVIQDIRDTLTKNGFLSRSSPPITRYVRNGKSCKSFRKSRPGD